MLWLVRLLKFGLERLAQCEYVEHCFVLAIEAAAEAAAAVATFFACCIRQLTYSSNALCLPCTYRTPPYDLSAFRPKPTSANSKVRTLQRKFCQMMPSGDRWRNMCDAPSPMQFFMVLKNNDPMYHNGRPYEVKSAFNGITMYPLGLIRERGKGAKYDSGKDGQQCEHIGFHNSLRDTMLVNPKWKMNLKVDKPGGPNGFNVAVKVFDSMAERRNVTRVIAAVNLISFFVFVWAVWILSVSVKESIPSLIDCLEKMRSRSETSFLYGYWFDVTGRGAESSSSTAVQHRIVEEEEGKWVEVRNPLHQQQCSID